jgi:hypothetical protein
VSSHTVLYTVSTIYLYRAHEHTKVKCTHVVILSTRGAQELKTQEAREDTPIFGKCSLYLIENEPKVHGFTLQYVYEKRSVIGL